MINKRFHSLIFSFIFLFSCSEDNSTPASSDNYDRKELLSNLVNNIIIPAHQNFNNELQLFESTVNSFDDDRSISNLEMIQDQFIVAYRAWQYIEMFNIGYAEEIYYASKMNIYPANTTRILENIYSLIALKI